MAIIATDGVRYSAVFNREWDPATGYCRDQIVYNGTVQTALQVGTVLGAYYTSLTLTPGAVVGTGNGTVGTASATSNQYLEIGTYTVRMTGATTFTVNGSRGGVIGTGATGTAFSANGLTFTVSVGGTAFVAGDVIPLVVAGTKKFKVAVATAVDGSQNVAAVVIGGATQLSEPQAVVAATDTIMLAMTRGPVILSKGGLTFDASFTGAALTTAYGQLAALGMIPETTN